MKTMIDKCIIEAKLADLERELQTLEEVFMEKSSFNKLENQVYSEAIRIEEQLSTMMVKLSEQEQQVNKKALKTSTSRIAIATYM
ncbi:hypothetical protein [Metabacillus malikii]|uniref:DUF2524 family protein n=1 Tax=Metabacillus malikii TaxID=1504265 RepID=A0ABT9Z966_9BACI|nr:hypothetical protein [Metabacillus malikii]MDQ0228796.1 hypothetical protein [Metabacillus malikii]